MARNVIYTPDSIAKKELSNASFEEGKSNELAYYQKIKTHFPALLEKIAKEQPHMIIFTDTSARPFHILAANLWHGLELGKKPIFRIIEPRGKDLSEWVKRQKLNGKKIVIFDEHVFRGYTLANLTRHLSQAGALVIPTAFTVNPRIKNTFVDLPIYFAEKSAVVAPWWPEVSEATPQLYSFKFPRLKTGSVRTKAANLRSPGTQREYAKQIATGMKELAREILAERKEA